MPLFMMILIGQKKNIALKIITCSYNILLFI